MMMIDGDDIDGPLNAVQRKRRGEGGRRRRRIIGKKPSDEKTAEAGDPAMRSALLSVEAERKKKRERSGGAGWGSGGTATPGYPSSLGGVNQPFFSWIWTSDLKDCWARARLYWPLVALNWMRALPLTSVAAICRISASIVYAELQP